MKRLICAALKSASTVTGMIICFTCSQKVSRLVTCRLVS